MRILSCIAVGTAILLLSLIASFNQIKAQGLSWQEIYYWSDVTTGYPGRDGFYGWGSYVIPKIVEPLKEVLQHSGIHRSRGISLVLLSIAFNIALLSTALAFYRKLGVPVYLGLFGLSALAWCMTQGNATTTLDFDRTLEAICFLLLAIIVLTQRDLLLLPLVFFAALNRESALLFPAIYLAGAWNTRGKGRVKWKMDLIFFAATVLSFLGTLPRPIPGFLWGDTPLLPHTQDLQSLTAFLLLVGPLPLLACWSFGLWPFALRRIAILLLPVWFFFLWFNFQGESKFLLVPMALVFVPGTLLTVCKTRGMDYNGERKTAHAV